MERVKRNQNTGTTTISSFDISVIMNNGNRNGGANGMNGTNTNDVNRQTR